MNDQNPTQNEQTAEQIKQRIANTQRLERLTKIIQEQTFNAVKHNLETYKKKYGPDNLQQAAIGFALYEFVQLLIQQGHIKGSPEADAVINVALRVMPDPVNKALETVTDSRIIVPGR